MWKSTLREIKQSFGRFMAIFAIIALGVSFFSGLKVMQTAMVATTDGYFKEKNFYNYRILSTLGFEQEDVEYLRNQEGVRSVEGAVNFDILCNVGAVNGMVLKAYSLPNQINDLEMIEGRLPEKETECVVDSAVFTTEDIGQQLVLSKENVSDDLEHFKYMEYTIVGLVQSSNYIQSERGNTSLGNGKIRGFCYLPMDGFDVDYFTEILVKFDEDFVIYTDAYKDYMDQKEAVWENLAEQASMQRYDRIVGEAEEELAEAKTEFEEEKAKAEAELEDARRDLADGKAELNDAKRELADAKIKLSDSRKELEDGKEQLEKGRRELWKAEKKISDGEAELDANAHELAKNRHTVEENMAQTAAARAQLNDAQSQLDAQRAELEAMASMLPPEQLEGAKQQLDAAQAELNVQKEMLDAAEKELKNALDGIAAGEQQIAAAGKELEKNKKEIKKAWETLSENEAELAEGEQKLIDGEAELVKAEKDLAEGWQEYYDGLAEYEEGLAEFETEIADAETEIADAEAEIEDIEEPESYVLGRETNVGYVCFENDSAIVDGIANVFPIFFYAVAALICITTMNRMVEEQRTQIGVLKALGYSQASIMGKYLFYSGTAAISGCLFGYFFGIWFFPKMIWYAYGSMYDVDDIVYIFDWGILLFSLIVSIVCSMGTTYLTCRKELSEVAAELMRPKAPKAGKRVLLERIPMIWNRMKFLHKVSYRNVFRYKKRFLMMVIGISGCTGLLLTGYGVKDSIANIANDQYERIQVYDINVMMAEELTEESAEAVLTVAENAATESLFVMEKTMDLVTEDAVKGVSVVAIDESDDISSYVKLPDENGNELPYPQLGQCVLTDKLAHMYQLQVGDTITLSGENNQTMELVLSGIAENYLYNYVYMTTQTYESCFGEEAVLKSIYINMEEGVEPHQLTADLMKLDEVASASVTSDAKSRFTSMIESLDLIIIVIIVCAGILAFIVLYNLTNINITERIREIATIKVLGFHKKETAAYIFRENLILTMIGALAGLGLGKAFHGFVMSQVQVDQVKFATRILPISYVYSVLLTMVFALIVNWFMRGKLEKISMTESLKSVD